LTIAGGGTVNVTTNGITGASANSDLIVDSSTLVLSVANSYNGPTTVQNSGILKLGGSNVLPTSPRTALTLNTSGAFDLASFSDSVASLTGDSTGVVKNSVASTTSTFTVNQSSGSTTFAGVIAGTNAGAQGDVALTKSGNGTLTLSGTNTYTGTTTINGGTLVLGNATNTLSDTDFIDIVAGTLSLGNNSDTLGMSLSRLAASLAQAER